MAVLGTPKVLSWKDFGTPVTVVPSAYTGTHDDCHIEVDIGFSSSGVAPEKPGGDYRINGVKVTVKVDALTTWVLDGVPKRTNQAAILKHEQGHFNIASLAAKDLEKTLIALRNADVGDLQTAADDALAAALSDGQAMQEQYDDDPVNGGTDHGQDATQQAKWTARIGAAKTLADLP